MTKIIDVDFSGAPKIEMPVDKDILTKYSWESTLKSLKKDEKDIETEQRPHGIRR